LYPLSAAVAWAAFIYKARDLRYSKNLALFMILGCFGFLGLTFTVSTPSVWSAIDRAADYPNLNALISQSCVMMFGISQQALLLLWSADPSPAGIARAHRRILRRVIAFAVALAGMMVLFFAAAKEPERDTDWVAQYAGEHDIATYLVVYVGAFLLIQSELVYLALYFARRVGDSKPLLRRGLRVTAIGGSCGVIYALARLADVFGAAHGLDPHRWESIPRLAAGVGEMFLPLGWTLPTWGPRVAAFFTWPKRWRDYNQLEDLWRLVTDAVPTVVLDQDDDSDSPRSHRWMIGDLGYRLTSRETEIRDGLRQLTPYRSPAETQAIEERALDLTGSARARTALIDYAALRAAAAAKAGGGPEYAGASGFHVAGRAELVRLARAGRSSELAKLEAPSARGVAA
jgi:hypothetical protein